MVDMDSRILMADMDSKILTVVDMDSRILTVVDMAGMDSKILTVVDMDITDLMETMAMVGTDNTPMACAKR
jgi:hypothetical protein